MVPKISILKNRFKANQPNVVESLLHRHNAIESSTASPAVTCLCSKGVSPKIMAKRVLFASQYSNRHSFNLNLDEILVAVEKFPKYKAYFQEKLGKIEKLEFLLANKKERAVGETKEFLKGWILHFERQINYVVNWLLKK